MSAPFLENNLTLEYPFADGTIADITAVVADAMVAGTQAGPYVLEVFTPNYDFLAADPLGLAQIQISGASGVFLNTATASSVDLGNGFRSLEAVDGTTGARARFVVQNSAVATLGGLLAPVELSAMVSHQIVDGLVSLQGLAGEVELDFNNYSVITGSVDGVVVDFDDPEDRVDCSGVDCDNIYSFAGARADIYGSLFVDATECYQLTPHPTISNRLILRNICKPCVDCDDVITAQNKITDQAGYYHRLSAIHHNQFNRYQRSVAAANAYIAGSEVQSEVQVPDQGTISIVDRVFNRPYFTQLYLAVVNNTTYHINVDLAVSITPAAVAAQLTAQPDSFLVQRTLSGGDPLTGFAGFPGSYSFNVDPQDSVGLNSESKRTTINDAQTVGQWTLAATITFLSGPAPLPAPQVINKILTPNIILSGSPLTTL